MLYIFLNQFIIIYNINPQFQLIIKLIKAFNFGFVKSYKNRLQKGYGSSPLKMEAWLSYLSMKHSHIKDYSLGNKIVNNYVYPQTLNFFVKNAFGSFGHPIPQNMRPALMNYYPKVEY